MAAAFPELDFSSVDPVYPGKSLDTPYAFTAAANKARGEKCLRDLYGRHEKVIAVVSHGGFLRTGISKRRYANADYRIFMFVKAADGTLELHEDAETERSGGGTGRSDIGVYQVRESDFPPENVEGMEVEEDGMEMHDDEKIAIDVAA